MRGPERVGGEGEAVGRAGGEVLHEHVGPGHQAGERLNGDVQAIMSKGALHTADLLSEITRVLRAPVDEAKA